MNNRTEPTKEQNEAAIRALKRESKGSISGLTDARAGLAYKGDKVSPGIYSVVAFCRNGSVQVNVADFWFKEEGDEWMRQETARIMAEELADRINEQ